MLTNQSASLDVAAFQNGGVRQHAGAVQLRQRPGRPAAGGRRRLSITTAAPTFNSDGTLKNSLPYQQPTPGQIGVLQVMYQWPVLGLPLGVNFANLGNGTYLMMSTQVFRVEPTQ